MSDSETQEFFPEKPVRFVPGWPVIATIGLLAAMGLLAWLRFDDLAERIPAAGPAAPRLIIAASIVFSVLVLVGWLVFRSSHSWLLKIGTVAVVVALPFLFRVEHSGDLFSLHVYPRWRAPDRLLESPKLDGAPPERFASLMSREDPFAFTQFMGPARDGSLPTFALADDWNPELLWRAPIGAGWSGFVAAHGLLITQEQRGDDELVTAYEIETGKSVWFHAESARHDEELGGIGPRATPTLHDGRVYAMGATGLLLCLNASDGALIWKRDVVADVGSDRATDMKLVMWGRAASPLIVDDKVVVPGGGKADAPVSLIAYDRLTGDEVWRGGDHQIGYSSPVLVELDGVRQIVTGDEAHVSGHDPADGKRLWTYEHPGSSSGDANTSQPQRIDGNSLLISKGYGAGAERIDVRRDADGAWQVTSVWKNPRALRTKLTSAILADGYAYGLNDGILECVSLDDGRSQWRKARLGHGQILRVGDAMIALSESGELSRVDVDPEACVMSEPIRALDGICWNTLCLYGDLVIIRNNREAACYRVRLKPSGQVQREGPDGTLPPPTPGRMGISRMTIGEGPGGNRRDATEPAPTDTPPTETAPAETPPAETPGTPND